MEKVVFNSIRLQTVYLPSQNVEKERKQFDLIK
jgi:hypothetical protein